MSWRAFIDGAARQALYEHWLKNARREREQYIPTPEQLLDAKHDKIHATSGRRLRSTKIKRRY